MISACLQVQTVMKIDFQCTILISSAHINYSKEKLSKLHCRSTKNNLKNSYQRKLYSTLAKICCYYYFLSALLSFRALSLIIYSPIIVGPEFKADFVDFYASSQDRVSRHCRRSYVSWGIIVMLSRHCIDDFALRLT